jgi:amidase
MGETTLIRWDKIHYLFDKDLPPAARIQNGATVVLRTERADCMLLSAERPVFRNRDDVIEANPNPVTGPIFVEGAEPGDFVRVSIRKVVPCPDGSLVYITHVPGPSALMPPFSLLSELEPETMWVKVEGGHMTIPFKGKTRTIETSSMIGTIGTAPKRARVQSYWSGFQWRNLSRRR